MVERNPGKLPGFFLCYLQVLCLLVLSNGGIPLHDTELAKRFTGINRSDNGAYSPKHINNLWNLKLYLIFIYKPLKF